MTKSIHTDEMAHLLDWLKHHRKEQELTMLDLAIRMELKSHSYIQKIEQGERRLDVVEYVWYCISLGIDPHTGIDLILQNLSADRSPHN